MFNERINIEEIYWVRMNYLVGGILSQSELKNKIYSDLE